MNTRHSMAALPAEKCLVMLQTILFMNSEKSETVAQNFMDPQLRSYFSELHLKTLFQKRASLLKYGRMLRIHKVV